MGIIWAGINVHAGYAYAVTPPDSWVLISVRVIVMASLNVVVIGIARSYTLLGAMYYFGEATK
jgi:hypothetical protein